MKSWFKENMDMGDWITIVSGFVITLLAIAAVYYAIIVRINTLEIQTDNIQKEVRQSNNQWDKLIDRLDNRYVNQQQFDDFRKNTGSDLKEIKDNINYLIKLEIESNKSN